MANTIYMLHLHICVAALQTRCNLHVDRSRLNLGPCYKKAGVNIPIFNDDHTFGNAFCPTTNSLSCISRMLLGRKMKSIWSGQM